MSNEYGKTYGRKQSPNRLLKYQKIETIKTRRENRILNQAWSVYDVCLYLNYNKERGTFFCGGGVDDAININGPDGWM